MTNYKLSNYTLGQIEAIHNLYDEDDIRDQIIEQAINDMYERLFGRPDTETIHELIVTGRIVKKGEALR